VRLLLIYHECFTMSSYLPCLQGNQKAVSTIPTICCEVLFGEPVYETCILACCMAFHRRLGASSNFAALERLEQVTTVTSYVTTCSIPLTTAVAQLSAS